MALKEETIERDYQNTLKRKHAEELRKKDSKRVIDTDELNQVLGDEDDKKCAGPSKKIHIRSVKIGTTIFIPHDILKNYELVATFRGNIVSSSYILNIAHFDNCLWR